MTAHNPRPGPAPASPYSALNGAQPAGRDEATGGAVPAADPEAALLATETERLGALKGALWASFQSAPASAVRAPIVDVTMAYTDALRMELKLRAAGKQTKADANARRAMARAGFKTTT